MKLWLTTVHVMNVSTRKIEELETISWGSLAEAKQQAKTSAAAACTDRGLFFPKGTVPYTEVDAPNWPTWIMTTLNMDGRINVMVKIEEING